MSERFKNMDDLRARMDEIDPPKMPVPARLRTDDYVAVGDTVKFLLIDDPELDIEVRPELKGKMLQGRVTMAATGTNDAVGIAFFEEVLVKPQEMAGLEVRGDDQIVVGLHDVRLLRPKDYELLWAYKSNFSSWARASVTDGRGAIAVHDFDAVLALNEYLGTPGGLPVYREGQDD